MIKPELTKPEKYYNREADGHSYYYRDCVLMACPTLKGGEPEVENKIMVKDFGDQLLPQEIREIIIKLTT